MGILPFAKLECQSNGSCELLRLNLGMPNSHIPSPARETISWDAWKWEVIGDERRKIHRSLWDKGMTAQPENDDIAGYSTW